MKRITTALFILAATGVFAQEQNSVSGTVYDQSNQALVGAEIYVPTLDQTFITDEKGGFSIQLPAGSYELEVQYLGFKQANQTVTINGQNVSNINFVLTKDSIVSGENVNLEGATITASRNKSDEAELLNIQRKSVNIVQAIGAQELERKGVGDVATAVTKVSGISKQENSSQIYVRGLGDRYNSTTMNKLPISSNDPEFKNIDLSIFSTDILDFIGIDKVYSGSFFGDFAGGNININTKEFSGKSFLKFGFNGRTNTNALDDKSFRLIGPKNYFGFDNYSRPNTTRSYDFENGMNPNKRGGAFGGGFNISGGTKFNIGNEGVLSFYATASYDNNYSSIKNGFSKAVNAQGVARKDFHTYNKYAYGTNTNGLFNATYKINKNHSVKFNTLYINSSNQKFEEYFGTSIDIGDDNPVLVRRSTYVKNTLLVNQLLGNHKLSERIDFNWSLGYNNVTSDLPDRIQNSYKDLGAGYQLASNSTSDNNRYYHNLNEDDFVGNISASYKFNQSDEKSYKGLITVGYNGRIKTRELEAVQFNLKALAPHHLSIINPDNIDSFFNQNNLASGLFEMSTYSGTIITPQFYNGDQSIHGAFVNLQYQLNDKLTGILSLRGEYVSQEVKWNTSIDPNGGTNTFDEFQFLPSLALKYEANNKSNFKLGASKTYTLPQFKERALFMYEDVTETVFGWPTLYPSKDYNLDLGWEFFPSRGEIISINGFGKYIQDPINKITVASSTNDLSYVNSGDWGYVYGAEIELRKNLFKTESSNPTFVSFGFNGSYTHTNQELNSEKIFKETLLPSGSRLNANFTNKEDGFQGASEFILNGDISLSKEWEKGSNIIATIAYNYFSNRIYALGTDGRGNIIDKGFGTLDFIIRSKIQKNIGINLSFKNLLNPSIDRIQENPSKDITIQHYKLGMNIGLGINYQL